MNELAGRKIAHLINSIVLEILRIQGNFRIGWELLRDSSKVKYIFFPILVSFTGHLVIVSLVAFGWLDKPMGETKTKGEILHDEYCISRGLPPPCPQIIYSVEYNGTTTITDRVLTEDGRIDETVTEILETEQTPVTIYTPFEETYHRFRWFTVSVIAYLVHVALTLSYGLLALRLEEKLIGSKNNKYLNDRDYLKNIVIPTMMSTFSSWIYALKLSAILAFVGLILHYIIRIPLISNLYLIIFWVPSSLVVAWLAGLQVFGYPMGNNGYIFSELKRKLFRRYKFATVLFGLILSFPPVCAFGFINATSAAIVILIELAFLPIVAAAATSLYVASIKDHRLEAE